MRAGDTEKNTPSDAARGDQRSQTPGNAADTEHGGGRRAPEPRPRRSATMINTAEITSADPGFDRRTSSNRRSEPGRRSQDRQGAAPSGLAPKSDFEPARRERATAESRPLPTDRTRRPTAQRGNRGSRPTNEGTRPAAAPGTGSDALWSLALETGRLFAGLTTFYLIARVLGDKVLGNYAAISGFVGLLNTLAATWLPQWVMESIVRRKRPAIETLRSAIGANLTFALIIGLGAVVITPYLLRNLLLEVSRQWLLLFLFAELIANLSSIWISMWGILRGYAYSCRLSLAYAVGRPALYLALWATGQLSLRNMSIVAISWSVVCGLGVRSLTQRLMRQRLSAGGFGKRLFIEGAPYAMTNVAYSIQEDLDKPLMIEMGHSADAGPYAAAYRIIQIAMVPLRSLVMATHLRFLQAGQKSGARVVIRQAMGLSMISSVLAILLGLGVVVCQPLVEVVLGPSYALSRPMLLPLIPLLVLRGVSWFPLNGLMALGHLRERVAVIASSASVNVVLNLLLIRKYSWRGAVIATVTAETVFAVMAWGFLYVRHRDDFARYRGMHFRKAN